MGKPEEGEPVSRFVKHFRYGETGFTLIEFLVVIVFLGALAAVAILNIEQFFDKGQILNRLIKLLNPKSLYEIETPVALAAVRG
jgi:prepilin-type N-terminal cleavage/methylation domain-containing protein